MKVENKRKRRIIKFLNGKAFYAVLAVSMIAVGVAAWSGIQGFKNMNESTKENNSSSELSLPSISFENTASWVDPPTVKPPAESLPQIESEPAEPSTPQDSEQASAAVATFFIYPVLGDVIKDFSDTELQFSVTMQDMRLHKAIDIAADAGTPILASGSGVVQKVYKDTLLGTCVEIDHGNGIVARYCGLNEKPCVNEGDEVDSSTRLGDVGVIPCESVEQRHLHLEFFKDGNAVSPLKYIKVE